MRSRLKHTILFSLFIPLCVYGHLGFEKLSDPVSSNGLIYVPMRFDVLPCRILDKDNVRAFDFPENAAALSAVSRQCIRAAVTATPAFRGRVARVVRCVYAESFVVLVSESATDDGRWVAADTYAARNDILQPTAGNTRLPAPFAGRPQAGRLRGAVLLVP